ncbi:MAG: hypothetical protein GXO37_07405 [Chloroflexi bacterium]|nr:hypothetical protein [Chloroflexota bacterium]
MTRVFRSQTLAQQRRRLLQMLAQTVRALAQHDALNDQTRDMVAFLILTLREIASTVETTTAAWEKRDYWLKADQFRLEWEWAAELAAALEDALQAEDWDAITRVVLQLVPHLSQVTLPKRPRWGSEPWRGAWRAWQAQRAPGPPPEGSP